MKIFKKFLKNKKKGFSLLETMFAIAFVSYALINLFLLLNSFLKTTTRYVNISNYLNKMRIIYSDSDPTIIDINIKSEKDNILVERLIKDDSKKENEENTLKRLRIKDESENIKKNNNNQSDIQIIKLIELRNNNSEKKG